MPCPLLPIDVAVQGQIGRFDGTFAPRTRGSVVMIPAGFNTGGLLIDVEGIPITSTDTAEPAFDQVIIAPNVDTGTFVLRGLRPADYRLRANARGLEARPRCRRSRRSRPAVCARRHRRRSR